ncbi:hypothetical protein [Nostoc sp. KVJ20]|uniref:hypothetical protein n=1 Tax=Nostoc sp. KVJ20 TaxID=457944 RepID=UPI00159F16FA|nr:hypothetical protein [Nostoc sp. KVJ20]
MTMFIYGLLMLLPANGFTGQCCDHSLRDIDGEGDGYFFADELFVDQADSTPSKVHLALIASRSDAYGGLRLRT